MIAVKLMDDKIVESRGFQLSVTEVHPRSPANGRVNHSFLLLGSPPTMQTDQEGWKIACGGTINNFYSGSGEFWTPQEWKRLSDSIEQLQGWSGPSLG
jgi:hypothetical protein